MKIYISFFYEQEKIKKQRMKITLYYFTRIGQSIKIKRGSHLNIKILLMYIFILAPYTFLRCSTLTVGEKLLIAFNENPATLQKDYEEISSIVPISHTNQKKIIDILKYGPFKFRQLSEENLLLSLAKYGIFSAIPLTQKIKQLFYKSSIHKKPILEWVGHFLLQCFIVIEGRQLEHVRTIENFADTIDLKQKGFSGAGSFLHILLIPNPNTWHDEDNESMRSTINFLLNKFIERGVDLNEKLEPGVMIPDGITALHLAAYFQDAEMCSTLLSNGALITIDLKGNAPLHVAICCESHLSTYKGLCNDPDRGSGRHSTTNEKKVKKLCKVLKSCINVRNSHGDTPLHWACRNIPSARSFESTEFIEPLLRYGAKKNVTNNFSQTPLHLAAIGNCLECCKNLEEDVNVSDIFGNRPIHYACAASGNLQYGGHLEIDFFANDIAVLNESGWNALHIACFLNLKELVKVLLTKYQFDVNAHIESSGKTPLMIACEKGYDTICLLLLEEASLDLSKRDKILGGALDWACEFTRVKVFEQLLKKGSLRLYSEKNKIALLHRICESRNFDLEELFMHYWDVVDSVNSKGNTVLHIACALGYEDVVKELLKKYTYDSLGGSKKNSKGQTAKSCATAKGHHKIYLLLAG